MAETQNQLNSLGISRIAEEFRQLDIRRRRLGLSLAEVPRYQALCSQLSEALATMERDRKVDARQFLRVPFTINLLVRTPKGPIYIDCHDFGGGGCAVSSKEVFRKGDDLWLDGAILDGNKHLLQGRGQIVWVRGEPGVDGATHFGVRFALESTSFKDQIDRVLYRVLEAFLRDDRELPTTPLP